MSDLKKIKEYIEIIDDYLCGDSANALSHVSPTHHTTFPGLSVDGPGFNLTLTNDMDLNVDENKLKMIHSLCHLFKNTGANGINKNDIKILHNNVVKKLESHFIFDSLDY